MDPQEHIEYLQVIQSHLYKEWLTTGDPDIKAEIECIAAEIARLKKHS
jgi:hypothetical protein